MAQPKFVPATTSATGDYYESPPRRDGSWEANRPGDTFLDGAPRGAGLGSQGPDQGFALTLARRFEDQLVLSKNEHAADAVAGCVAVALKRASLFGRAPMVHDVRLAFDLFGFFDRAMPDDHVRARRSLFAEVAHPHHYTERRRIPDLVPAELLRQPNDAIAGDAKAFRARVFKQA